MGLFRAGGISDGGGGAGIGPRLSHGRIPTPRPRRASDRQDLSEFLPTRRGSRGIGGHLRPRPALAAHDRGAAGALLSRRHGAPSGPIGRGLDRVAPCAPWRRRLAGAACGRGGQAVQPLDLLHRRLGGELGRAARTAGDRRSRLRRPSDHPAPRRQYLADPHRPGVALSHRGKGGPARAAITADPRACRRRGRRWWIVMGPWAGARRILILGSPGAGKTSFARLLPAMTGLPLVHLDDLYWAPDWFRPADDDWSRRLAAAAAEPAWIIDGNYAASLANRADRAEMALVG